MQLDPQQRAAVETTAQKALIVASPGSGKTRCLTERCAYLVENCKVSCYELVCITFTRKASIEMRERLEARLGKQAHKITACTLHSLALSLINRHCETAGLRAPITVYSEWEEQFLLKQVAREYDLYTGKAWKKVKKKDVDRFFAHSYQWSGPAGDEFDERIVELWNAFQARTRENNSLTYGALLLQLLKILPQIFKWLPYRHILVDEVQDIDLLQWQIINDMKDLLKTDLFAVGDISQAIYAWRGAAPDYLIKHEHEFTVYHLSTNYRSGKDIVAACNQLIENNEMRIDNPMISARDNGAVVTIHRGLDSDRLASRLYGLEDLWSNMAVLSRNHALLKKLSQELEARNIPHQYLGRKSKLKETELFRRFHAFLKLLVNPHDNFSFLLIKDLIGLSDDDYQRVRVTAAGENLSHLLAWMLEQEITPYTDFFMNQHPLSARAFQIKYMATGALPYGPDGWGWELEEVGQVFAFIMEYLVERPNATIEDYLTWLATYDVQDEIEEKAGITLSTIHGAKGLEWPMVYAYGMNEGLLPSKQATTPEDIEAERRLAFVAMSRAEQDLRLVVRPEESEGKDGRVYQNPESRFVKEITL